MNCMQLKRIDFNSSNIVSPGTSRGVYKLVAIVKIHDLKNSDKSITYGLGQSVLAGNMYVEKGLLKKPPYLFQISGSVNDQRIFRTFFPNTAKSEFPDWVKNVAYWWIQGWISDNDFAQVFNYLIDEKIIYPDIKKVNDT